MLKKIYLLLLLVSLIVFSVSCGDDKKEEAKECSSVCETYEDCNDGVCKLQADRCKADFDCTVDDKNKCNLTTNTCEEEGTVTCTDGETKCHEDTFLMCGSQGWIPVDCAIRGKLCKVIDNVASCVEEVAVCTDGETKCDVNTLSVCTNNTWADTDCTLTGKICKTDNEVSSCVEDVITEMTIPEVKALTDIKTVITSGVITYIIEYDNKVGGFYMQEGQEANDAIYVFIKDGASSSLKLGDKVKVTGITWKSFGVVRIGDNENTPIFEIKDPNSTVPSPKDLTSSELALGHVDMLINITNTPFTVISLGEAPLYHTIIKDAQDNELIINSKLYRFNENGLTVGSIVSNIKGIAGSYQNNDETFKFMVRPRTANDITFDNDGTEGFTCRDTDPKCVEGLKCNENNICELRLPCDEACTELQYCDIVSDTCIDLTVDPIADVRTLTEEKRVIVEGYVSFYKSHNQTTKTIYLQDSTDAYSGIVIYIKGEWGSTVSVGQKIRVLGLASEYQGFMQIGTATDMPIITNLNESLENTPKAINSTEINAENLSILVELANPPFTVTEVEFDHPKYVTFTDSLGNSFLLNNDWVNDWEYFIVGDVLTSLKGLVSYRYSNGTTFTINPRSEDDFEFQITE